MNLRQFCRANWTLKPWAAGFKANRVAGVGAGGIGAGDLLRCRRLTSHLLLM
jgi:hypothetical protein